VREADYFGDAVKRSAEERRRRIEANGIRTERAQHSEDFVGYGFDYYDNPDYGVGYGGYHYDGRYQDVARRFCEDFGLRAGDRVLEVGCAKGYILYEFHRLGLDVTGADASAYAIAHAKEEIRDRIVLNSGSRLPFTDGSFDFVLAKEVIPHLEEAQALELIAECMRVARDRAKLFLELQCANSDEGALLMKAWDVTHLTIKPDRWWVARLRELGYEGAYHCKPLF
jgi:protein-L-isoaspartate(D-aspartate) O-methyltransferase